MVALAGGALAIPAVAVAAPAHHGHAKPQPKGSTFKQDDQDYVQQVVDLTNEQRRQHGCGDLTVNSGLANAAQGHSADMADNNYFDHASRSGEGPSGRIADQGYHAQRWAENIAAGYDDPKGVVGGWMRSTDHRENILNCKLREIGVGYARTDNSTYHTYWTQDFGTKS